MQTVILARNSLEPESWESYQTEDIREFLIEEFPVWPTTARIYHKQVCELNNVTPCSDKDIEQLAEMDGPFYVIIYPGEPTTLLIAAVAIVAIAAIALAPKVPNVANRNTDTQSANNELSERSNKARIAGRIPDIFGTVRSTPDLIATPYKVFENNQEVEYALMCIGRGAYNVSDIRDGTTLVSNIGGSSVKVFSPNTSPNSGLPQLLIGSNFSEPVYNVSRSNGVNGQVLRPPNDQKITADRNIRFSAPNEIQLDPSSSLDFTDYFASGDNLTISNSRYFEDSQVETQMINADSSGYFKFLIPSSTLPPQYIADKPLSLTAAQFYVLDEGTYVPKNNLDGNYIIENVSLDTVIDNENNTTKYYCKIALVDPELVNPQWQSANLLNFANANITTVTGKELYDFNGQYLILSVSNKTIVLNSPQTVKPDWSLIGTTDYGSPTLVTNGDKWVGPIILNNIQVDRAISNFIAVNGLYSDDGNNQNSLNVICELEFTPINSTGGAIGPTQTFQVLIQGSATLKSYRAATLRVTPSGSSMYSVRARRVSQRDLNFKGNVSDEIQWRDLYAVNNYTAPNFGNVTTIQSVTYATSGALAVKERKLNCLVTRKIPIRTSGSNFTNELYPTNQADEIIAAICLDQRIGNRPKNQVDFDQIYQEIQAARDYFGTALATEFCYTFDSTNLSFEETIKSIADAAFCTAFRRGSTIQVSFEKQTNLSKLLFNNFNKLPKTETRTQRLGRYNENDGISFQYISPIDDASINYYIPTNRSAINPKTEQSIGIRNALQAYFHSWRMWNKIQYQNLGVEFQATQEADLLLQQDRILVTDGTRSLTQEGEILEQNVLELTLSNSVVFKPGISYSIFLQTTGVNVESISITPGSHNKKVILASAPNLPLVTGDEYFARSTYMIVGNDENAQTAFLVTDKTPQDNFTVALTAINYDSRYYQNDKDYLNSVIDINANSI